MQQRQTIRQMFVPVFLVAMVGPCTASWPLPVAPASDAPSTQAMLRGLESQMPHRTDARSPLRTHETEHFILVDAYDPAWSTTLGRALEDAYDAFYDCWEQAGFRLQRNGEPLVWVFFDDSRHYESYSERADRNAIWWTKSYYSSRTNRVALLLPSAPEDPARMGLPVASADGQAMPTDDTSPGLDLPRARHELAHQLAFNAGLQKRGVMYPIWVSEGIATNFESGRLDTAVARTSNARRCRTLLRAVKTDNLLPLREFVVMTRTPPGKGEDRTMAYAQSWGLFRYLFHNRRNDLKEYLSALHALRPGRRSESEMLREFERAFGPLSVLERQWREHVRSLRSALEAPAPAQQVAADAPAAR